MVTTTESNTTTNKPSLMEKSVLVSLKLGKLGNSKKIKDGAAGLKDVSGRQVEVDADKDSINVSKRLLEAEELVAISKLDSEIRNFIYNQCLPSFALEGVYILPNNLIKDTEDRLKAYAELRREAVAKFLFVYNDRVKEAAERLRAVYDPSDYPSAEEAGENFTMEWSYLTLGIPEALKDHDLYEAEAEKSAARLESMEAGIKRRMRENFSDIVNHMVDKLSGEREGGKIKIFRDSMLDNAKEFIAGFAFKNLAEDNELAELVAEFAEILDEVTADDLRKHSELRENTRAGVVDIQGKLQKLMEGAA